MRTTPGMSSDPLRHAGVAAQMLDNENKRDNAPVSARQRKAAYVAIAALGIFLIGIVALFFIM